MRTYYYIIDRTTSETKRLVGNHKWLESKYVELIRVINARSYDEAKKQIKED